MLITLLKSNQKFSPTYGRSKLSNHMSMSLIALSKMGANDSLLENFYSHHLPKLILASPLDSDLIITSLNWTQYLGHSDSYSNYLNYFNSILTAKNLHIIVSHHLSQLTKGISSQGFHCLIRLAYSIDILDIDEIAASLAYFSSEYSELKNIETADKAFNTTPLGILKTIQSLHLNYIQEKTINDALLEISSIPEFTSINSDIANLKINISECANLCLNIYANTNHFLALHMVTATYALRLLTPYINNLNITLKYYWQAICAAYIAINSPSTEHKYIPAQDQISWQEIFAKAIISTDDHIIKFIYTCFEEDNAYPNPLYKILAQKTASRIK